MEQNLVCENCGGTLAIDNSGETGTCIYCGTKKQLIEKVVTVVEHTGKIEIDGIATATSKLTSAYQCFQNGNIEKANRLYKEITELEPQNPYAWWGRYLCEENFAQHYGFKDKYGNSDDITKANQILEILKYADFAIQYANDDVKQQYIDQTQSYRDFVESVKNQPTTEPPPKSKKGLIIGIIVIVIIFLIIGNL